MRHPSSMASKSVPLPRVDRQPVLHLHRQHAPGGPTLVVLRLPCGRVLGDLVVALQAPGRQRQVIQVAREVAARQPPPRSRRRVLSCQQPAGTDKPCSAVGGLFEAEPRHRRWSRSRSSPSAGGALHTAHKGAFPFEELPAARRHPSPCVTVRSKLTQFTTARSASPAPLAGSRCSRPSPRPAPLACGPGRPCAAAPACACGCASRCRRFLSR